MCIRDSLQTGQTSGASLSTTWWPQLLHCQRTSSSFANTLPAFTFSASFLYLSSCSFSTAATPSIWAAISGKDVYKRQDLTSILPACFSYAWNFTFVSKLSEADTADTVFLQYRVRSSTQSASGVCASGILDVYKRQEESASVKSNDFDALFQCSLRNSFADFLRSFLVSALADLGLQVFVKGRRRS